MKNASLLGDAANGGQIVMSGEAVSGSDMELTRSGVVLKHQGLYGFQSTPNAVRLPCYLPHTRRLALAGASFRQRGVLT